MADYSQSRDQPIEDLHDLYENAPCGYISVCPDGKIVKSNATVLRWLGYDFVDIENQPWLNLLTSGGKLFCETHINPLLRMQGFVEEIALDAVCKDQSIFPIILNAAEKRDENNSVIFIRLTFFKATDRRQFEKNIMIDREAARQQAENARKIQEAVQFKLNIEKEAVELREQFMAVLGHDLRNPLAAMKSGVRLLQSEELSERGSKIVALMDQTADRAIQLVNDIMDLARVRLGGGIELEMDANADMTRLLQQIVDEHCSAYPEQIFKFESKITRSFPFHPSRMGQLIGNLIGNAVSHGEKNSPIEITGITKDNRFELRISNHGNPIPKEIKRHLFKPFFRGEMQSSNQGLGLGLHIASEIAKAHGGRLSVISKDRLSTFVFKMPISQPKD